ncbi:flagellar basal body rod protein FlgC [Psychromarinibacter sp. S121]|uniref:flagellar basal body rod protein FlgC n=1 Tax=Psychromarinibacter sp. S121 TaxID=3415127 RepID=UPI003C799F73
MDNLSAVSRTAGSALRAQSERLRIISENMANADSTGLPGTDPYRRKVVTFSEMLDRESGANMVRVSGVSEDPAPMRLHYDPSHPSANEEGFVARSNVEPLVEMVNMREAARSYEANLNMMSAGREMRRMMIDILG